MWKDKITTADVAVSALKDSSPYTYIPAAMLLLSRTLITGTVSFMLGSKMLLIILLSYEATRQWIIITETIACALSHAEILLIVYLAWARYGLKLSHLMRDKFKILCLYLK